MLSGSELREMAAAKDREAEASFQRSDTDGFLSQWADGLAAQRLRLEAEIADNGGQWRFKGLFDRKGRRVRARLVSVVDRFHGFGQAKKDVWCVLDARGKAVAWVNAHRDGPRSKMAQMGLHEDWEQAPAKAAYDGVGHGLSGRAWVVAKRLDRGFPEDAVDLEAA